MVDYTSHLIFFTIYCRKFYSTNNTSKSLKKSNTLRANCARRVSKLYNSTIIKMDSRFFQKKF